MRLRTPRSVSLFFALQTVYTALAGSDYGVPVQIQLWDNGRTPLAHMVDVTNEFGLKVLAEHNFLNDNNIAFSPYGLTGIIVALYEGVDGESSYQIQQGMQLPWNRNVMRVGFRDIHRTLKTYFVPEEGFLAGLALNNENVTFNDNYKKILRFYGFDLENEQLPTLPPQGTQNGTSNEGNETVATTTVTSAPTGTTSAPYRDDAATANPEREETTPSLSTANTEGIDIRGPSETQSSSSAPNTESVRPQSTTNQQTNTPDTIATVRTTAMETTTITTVTPTQTEPQTTTSGTTPSATPATEAVTTTQATSPIVTETTTTQPTTVGTESTINNEVEILTTVSEVPSSASVTESVAADSTMSTTTTVAPEVISSTTDTTTNVDETTSINIVTSTAVINESTLETLERRKKSIVDFIFTNPPYMQDLIHYRSFDIGPEMDLNYGDKMFLANGLRNVQVSYMHYDTTLEHAYLPHLEASALRLPLDSDRYYLLVVLPSRGGQAELGRLIARMARESDLRDVHAALRPKRVKAIVPSFTVKGHVTLTTDLQKLGIRDVFEPRQRDFTPMTPQSGVYVRSVEQAVSVAIRKYRPDEQKPNRYVTNRYPVYFSATYPFLYFVMDSNVHVALMAGKMVDPLNNRIL